MLEVLEAPPDRCSHFWRPPPSTWSRLWVTPCEVLDVTMQTIKEEHEEDCR